MNTVKIISVVVTSALIVSADVTLNTSGIFLASKLIIGGWVLAGMIGFVRKLLDVESAMLDEKFAVTQKRYLRDLYYNSADQRNFR